MYYLMISFFDLLVRESNECAPQILMAHRTSEFSSISRLKDLIILELNIFIGFLLHVGQSKRIESRIIGRQVHYLGF